jgi:ferredoxin/nitroreductase
MAIPTSRTKEPGIIAIDREKCRGCGKCVMVCSDLDLELFEGKARATGQGIFGCIGCGQCMAVCPEEAILVTGRCLSPDDMFALPPSEDKASLPQLMALWQRRRSIRKFRSTPVDRVIIDNVLEAAQTAPMGLPPTDVRIMVLDSREKVRLFTEDFVKYLEKMKWFASSWFLALMRPFWGKETDELFRGFMRPLFNKYISAMKTGENVVTYDAPVALYFYGSPYSDPADPIIAATYAMMAAESLGLGTCFLGAIHPFIQNGGAAKKFRERHGIQCKSREGLFVIMGYPKAEYLKGIRRGFAGVN